MKTRSWLLLLLLAALAVRLGWCWSRPVDEAELARSLPDQHEYLQIGRNVLAGQGLSFTDARFEQRVYAFRTPGYPLLIAACAGNVRAVQSVQCFLDTYTVLATFILARRWLAHRSALLAAVVVAVNPFLIFFCSLVLTETLAVALLIWGMALISRPGGNSSGGATVERGWYAGPSFAIGLVLLALGALVRPSAVLLPLILGCGAIAANGGSLRRIVGGAALAIGLTVAVLLPWAARNRMVLNEWVWTATNGGFTLYDGFHPGADGSSNQSFIAAMPELQAMNEVDRSRSLGEKAIEWARAHPAEVIALAGKKLLRTWSPIPLSQEYGGRVLYVIVAIAYSGPLLLLAVVGLFCRSLTPSTKIFLLLPAIYFSVSHALSVGSLRYRIPAEPPLAVLAASAVAGWKARDPSTARTER